MTDVLKRQKAYQKEANLAYDIVSSIVEAFESDDCLASELTQVELELEDKNKDKSLQFFSKKFQKYSKALSSLIDSTPDHSEEEIKKVYTFFNQEKALLESALRFINKVGNNSDEKDDEPLVIIKPKNAWF